MWNDRTPRLVPRLRRLLDDPVVERYLPVLVAAKVLDALTTGIGLASPLPVQEANPFVVVAVVEFGLVAGLAIASVVSVGLILFTSELFVRVGAWVGVSAGVVRRASLIPASFVFAAAGLYNAVLLSWLALP